MNIDKNNKILSESLAENVCNKLEENSFEPLSYKCDPIGSSDHQGGVEPIKRNSDLRALFLHPSFSRQVQIENGIERSSASCIATCGVNL